ncbi:MAG: RdgB/HAM1 family non-canonical purine NTP pyrophosphatase [Candidatus Eremiobacteraeota bacterium]|nr:RdgB/HAM1 family non-canonical purine NTP pyrophosphatase [Candidatus Eremiobacteraeota bacterium]
MRRLYAATKNPGKLCEMAEIAAAYDVEAAAWPGYREPDETADSYAGNAALKARALRAQLLEAGFEAAAVLADDSGLEIAALGGRPGVHSARYAGSEATWPQRRSAILREVAASGSSDRRARFVCVLCYIGDRGAEIFAEGSAEGELTRAPSGELGFGYDPIFYEPSEHATFAELSARRKNALSHRAKALKALFATLQYDERR